VVAIIALVSGGVAIAAFKFHEPAKRKTATTSARAIRGAVKSWWLEHESSQCPSLKELIDDEALDEDNAQADPWGKPWRIDCANNDVTVSSTGSDRIAGTADDIRVPPT